SALQPLRQGLVQGGADAMALGARVFGAGETADEINSTTQDMAVGAGAQGQGRFGRAVAGATRFGVPMAAVGRATSALGLGQKAGQALTYGYGGAVASNQAITEGRDAGLEGKELASYAA